MRYISLILSACIGLVLLQAVHGDEPAPIDSAASVLAVLKAQPDAFEANFELIERYLVAHETLMQSREDTEANRAYVERLNANQGDGLELGRYLQRLIFRGKLPAALDERARELKRRHGKLYGMMGDVADGLAQLFPWRSAGVAAEEVKEEIDGDAAAARNKLIATWNDEKKALLRKGIHPVAHQLYEQAEKIPDTPSDGVGIVMAYLKAMRQVERVNSEDVRAYLREDRFVSYFRRFAREIMDFYQAEPTFNPEWREKEMLLLKLMTMELDRFYLLHVITPREQAVESPWLVEPRRMTAPEVAMVMPLLQELQAAIAAEDWGTVVNSVYQGDYLVGKRERFHKRTLKHLLEHEELREIYQHAVPSLLADQANFFVCHAKGGRYRGQILVRKGTKVEGVEMPEIFGLDLMWFPEYDRWGQQPIRGMSDWVPADDID